MYPKQINSLNAKRHVKCLPIRLMRPQNNLRKENKEISMTTLLELSQQNIDCNKDWAIFVDCYASPTKNNSIRQSSKQ